MASYLRPGLTISEASNICMNVCRAMCCRGPLLLELLPGEVPAFYENGRKLHIDLKLNVADDGRGWVRFADHPGESCPMLNPVTFQCRIYDDRPARCREFPEKQTPGCQISGG